MTQIRDGLASVTNGSAVVAFSDVVLTGNALHGHLFSVGTEGIWYEILTVDSATQVTLTSPYGGITAPNVAYVIHQTFTDNLKLPYPGYGDKAVGALLQKAFVSLDGALAALGTVNDIVWASAADTITLRKGVTTVPSIPSGLIIKRGALPDAKLVFRDDLVTPYWDFGTASVNVGEILVGGTPLTIDPASETVAGKVELATAAESITGTSNSLAVHPAGLKATIDARITALVDSSPSTLDTLNELAAALGDDPNFATTITTLIGTKATGPASATDNAIARFDATTGKLLQNSGVTIDDSNNLVVPGSIQNGTGAYHQLIATATDATIRRHISGGLTAWSAGLNRPGDSAGTTFTWASLASATWTTRMTLSAAGNLIVTGDVTSGPTLKALRGSAGDVTLSLFQTGVMDWQLVNRGTTGLLDITNGTFTPITIAPSTGHVSIGLGVAGAYRLDVRDTTDNVMRISGGGANAMAWLLRADNGGTAQEFQFGVTKTTHSWGKGFYIYSNTDARRDLFIDASGVLVVGGAKVTKATQALFDIERTGGATAALVTTAPNLDGLRITTYAQPTTFESITDYYSNGANRGATNGWHRFFATSTASAGPAFEVRHTDVRSNLKFKLTGGEGSQLEIAGATKTWGLNVANATGEIYFQNVTDSRFPFTIDAAAPTHSLRLLSSSVLITQSVRIGAAATPGATVDAGVGTVSQTSAVFSARGVPNAFEWGHQNAAGYANTFGFQSSSGRPYIVFNGEAGSTVINTIRTRGVKARGIIGDNAGGMSWFTVANANADDQTIVTDLTLSSLGYLGFGAATSPTSPIQIGTTGTRITPGGGYLVQSFGGGNSYWLLNAGANFNSAVHFGDPDSNTIGKIEYIHNGDRMEFHTAGAERMRITSGGNLLLGTTTDAGPRLNILGAAGTTVLQVSDGTYGTFGISFNATYGIEFGSVAGSPINFKSNNIIGLTLATTGQAQFPIAPKLPSYTVATVPSAATMGAGSQIYVSNEAGGATVAFSDGTNWRKVHDRAVIS